MQPREVEIIMRLHQCCNAALEFIHYMQGLSDNLKFN